jgi:hypothetical protein
VLGSGLCYEQRNEVDINVEGLHYSDFFYLLLGGLPCEFWSATWNYGKPEVDLNHIFKFRSYPTENTSISNYKHQSVNSV